MEFDPSFEKLIDRKIEDAVNRHVQPSWFCLRTIWLGALGSLLATGLLYAAAQAMNWNEGEHVMTVDQKGP
jgi:hypothetical protein